ncbi:MAG TPA: glycosyltransferase family 4 protein [Flavipsychrobacter sp.]|nr:glycosyltransferase family 4 protein [Flavipsychrobacter sp.]
MPYSNCSIFTIAPYRLFPTISGGPTGIIHLHNYIAKLCPDHIISTVDNAPAPEYSFDLHNVFTVSPKRYIPFYQQSELVRIAKTYDCNHIICEHPYMAISAMWLARKLKVPWYIRSHNIESERFRTLGKKWWRLLFEYEKFAMRRSNGVFFISGEDAAWAMNNYSLPKSKSHFVPYGTNFKEVPEGHEEARTQIANELNIDPDKPWLYFLGALDYYPNTQAVSFILDEIVPRLNNAGIMYELLFAGKGLPETLQQQIEQIQQTRYLGFLPSLNNFIKGCDILLNPLILGGGTKSKAVEALGYGKTVISTLSGSAGILKEVCGNSLLVSPDNDWDAFTGNIIKAIEATDVNTPKSFYDFYYWGNIAKQVMEILNDE